MPSETSIFDYKEKALLFERIVTELRDLISVKDLIENQKSVEEPIIDVQLKQLICDNTLAVVLAYANKKEVLSSTLHVVEFCKRLPELSDEICAYWDKKMSR